MINRIIIHTNNPVEGESDLAYSKLLMFKIMNSAIADEMCKSIRNPKNTMLHVLLSLQQHFLQQFIIHITISIGTKTSDIFDSVDL